MKPHLSQWNRKFTQIIALVASVSCVHQSLPSDLQKPATTAQARLAQNSPPLQPSEYPQRASTLIQHFAQRRLDHFPHNLRLYARPGIYHAMAKYEVGDIATANALTERIFSGNLKVLGNDQAFVVMSGMDLYLRYRHHMPPGLRWRIRQYVTQDPQVFKPLTANHRLMLATGHYLAAQTWPDWPQALRIRQQTKKQIQKFTTHLGEHGMIEHDSPVYHVFYLNSLLSLQDHVVDPAFRQRTQVGLELLLAAMAPEWLNGYWATTTLRTPAFTHDPHQAAHIGPVGWLYWGGRQPPMWLGAAVMHAVSEYRVPEILVKISRDRTQPDSHRETQGANFNGPAKYRKYTYMDRQYALFSQYDGLGELAWHDQMQRMGLVWDASSPGAALVIKQPVKGARGDTKTGQVLQHQRTLIGVYQGPVTAFIPQHPSIVHRFERSGWLFLHSSSVLIGLKLVNDYQRQDTVKIGFSKRYRGTFERWVGSAGQNGVILQTAPVEDFAQASAQATLEAFAQTILSQTKIDQSRLNQETPILTFKDLEGNHLALTFNGDRNVNNQPINYRAWPLLDNPWMKSNRRFCLKIQYENTIRKYNCNKWTIQEHPR